MTPADMLIKLEGLGYRLSLRPGGLRLTGAAEPPPEVLAMIREHRDDLLDLLRDLAEERAGVLEFCAGFSRTEAELMAGIRPP